LAGGHFSCASQEGKSQMPPIKNRYSENSLNQQVANKTGEDVDVIRRMGFSPLGPNEIEERHEPLVVDWDLLAASR
jgi:hypothetical protein